MSHPIIPGSEVLASIACDPDKLGEYLAELVAASNAGRLANGDLLLAHATLIVAVAEKILGPEFTAGLEPESEALLNYIRSREPNGLRRLYLLSDALLTQAMASGQRVALGRRGGAS